MNAPRRPRPSDRWLWLRWSWRDLRSHWVAVATIALILAVLLALAIAHYIKRGLRPLAARSDLDIWSRRLVVAGMVIAKGRSC